MSDETEMIAENSTVTAMSSEKKKNGAKEYTFIAQVVAAVWIGGFSAFKLIKAGASAEITDIILSGFAIAACFIPVYFSIILDKIKTIRFGDSGR